MGERDRRLRPLENGLPLQVDQSVLGDHEHHVASGRGDDVAGCQVLAELVELAAMFASPAILAAADRARGAALLADGDSACALECLQRAADLWRDANAPVRPGLHARSARQSPIRTRRTEPRSGPAAG